MSKLSISKGYFSVFTYRRQLDISAIDFLFLLETWLPWSPCHHIFLSSVLYQSLPFACFFLYDHSILPRHRVLSHYSPSIFWFHLQHSSRIMFANNFQVPIIGLDSLLDIKIHMLNYKMCNTIRINNKNSNSTCLRQKLFIPPLNLFLFPYFLFSLW